MDCKGLHRAKGPEAEDETFCLLGWQGRTAWENLLLQTASSKRKLQRELFGDLQRKQKREEAIQKAISSRTWAAGLDPQFDFESFVFTFPRHPFSQNPSPILRKEFLYLSFPSHPTQDIQKKGTHYHFVSHPLSKQPSGTIRLGQFSLHEGSRQLEQSRNQGLLIPQHALQRECLRI